MDRMQARDVLSRIPYGLYIAGSNHGGESVGMIVTWASQISFFPQLVAMALENDSPLKVSIDKSGFFSLNVLPAGSTKLAASFLRPGSSTAKTINGRPYEQALHGSPFLTEASAGLECKVVNHFPAGDHVIVVGEVVDAKTRKGGDVLTMKETGWNYQR